MRARSSTLLALLALLTLFASPAGAINQPRGGPQIPVGAALAAVFRARSETFDVRADAAITPERFVPGCRLNFTLVTRGDAGFQNAFGWYNVRPGMAPDPSDLHVLIPCEARAGQRFTLDLRTEAAYRGGEIGFFLRTPEVGMSGGCSSCCAALTRPGYTYFSERQHNPDNQGADSYIHLLIYDSRVTSNAFYFAWEDLYSGGDNNFTDFVALVDNIVCTGAGAPCDTGVPGVCSLGTAQCRSGALQCVQTLRPSAERCDGIDNNCNGMTDEGEGLCPGTQLCERGVCVDRCLNELGCFDGQTCTPSGACVDTPCAMMTCPAGQRCSMGRCIDPCEGVRCPYAQVCRVGRCLDPCAGVTCEGDQVCVTGVCVPRCECRRCASAETCASDGRCRSSGCATMTCPAGQYCSMGVCTDGCRGAVCPRGERCELGACVAVPVPDGGLRDASSRDITLNPRDVSPSTSDTNIPTDDRGVNTRDVLSVTDASSDAGIRFVPDSPGCGCRTADAEGRGRAQGAGALLWVLIGLTRRKRPIF